MNQRIHAVRGMRDLFAADVAQLAHIEAIFREVLISYSYVEIRTPIVERERLFNRGLGSTSDAVSKEMYTFPDRGDEILALRPEGTASVVRAVIDQDLCYNDKPRLWYSGPMFRHERPQAGRYRQFHQIGAEALGYTDAVIDVELISIMTEIFDRLAISSSVQLLMNNIGTPESRTEFKRVLLDALQPVSHLLDDDSRNRLQSNPLRILDSKVPATQDILKEAPKLKDSLSDSSKRRFDEVLQLLDRANISYTIDDRLVRGFDYYTDTVFEWVTEAVGAQDALCAGGRYDELTELLGGRPTPAIGFAAGTDRIALIRQHLTEFEHRSVDLYVVPLSENAQEYSHEVAKHVRGSSNIKVREHIGQDRLKTKMKWADRSGAIWAVIVGDNEVANRSVTLKWLRTERTQVTIPLAKLTQTLTNSGER